MNLISHYFRLSVRLLIQQYLLLLSLIVKVAAADSKGCINLKLSLSEPNFRITKNQVIIFIFQYFGVLLFFKLKPFVFRQREDSSPFLPLFYFVDSFGHCSL
jgi:hypothetical protein